MYRGTLHTSLCNRPKAGFSTRSKSVPSSDESPVCVGVQIVGRGVVRLHVTSVDIPVRVSETCDCRFCAVGNDSLEIEAIMVMLARLRDVDAIESEVTLTE